MNKLFTFSVRSYSRWREEHIQNRLVFRPNAFIVIEICLRLTTMLVRINLIFNHDFQFIQRLVGEIHITCQYYIRSSFCLLCSYTLLGNGRTF